MRRHGSHNFKKYDDFLRLLEMYIDLGEVLSKVLILEKSSNSQTNETFKTIAYKIQAESNLSNLRSGF